MIDMRWTIVAVTENSSILQAKIWAIAKTHAARWVWSYYLLGYSTYLTWVTTSSCCSHRASECSKTEICKFSHTIEQLLTQKQSDVVIKSTFLHSFFGKLKWQTHLVDHTSHHTTMLIQFTPRILKPNNFQTRIFFSFFVFG